MSPIEVKTRPGCLRAPRCVAGCTRWKIRADSKCLRGFSLRGCRRVFVIVADEAVRWGTKYASPWELCVERWTGTYTTISPHKCNLHPRISIRLSGPSHPLPTTHHPASRQHAPATAPHYPTAERPTLPLATLTVSLASPNPPPLRPCTSPISPAAPRRAAPALARHARPSERHQRGDAGGAAGAACARRGAGWKRVSYHEAGGVGEGFGQVFGGIGIGISGLPAHTTRDLARRGAGAQLVSDAGRIRGLARRDARLRRGCGRCLRMGGRGMRRGL